MSEATFFTVSIFAKLTKSKLTKVNYDYCSACSFIWPLAFVSRRAWVVSSNTSCEVFDVSGRNPVSAGTVRRLALARAKKLPWCHFYRESQFQDSAAGLALSSLGWKDPARNMNRLSPPLFALVSFVHSRSREAPFSVGTMRKAVAFTALLALAIVVCVVASNQAGLYQTSQYGSLS
jgi:hypothetical protein